jgi:cell wall-associated NlpC family hydrolase
VWLLSLVVTVVVSFVAWRWLPRPQPPATPQMRAATARLASSPTTATSLPVAPTSPTTDRDRLIAAAFAMQGVPYGYGAKGPATLDCSGFTKKAYAAVGVALPDGSFKQAASEKPLSPATDLMAGDLLFYRWAHSDSITHVTMYAGGGWVIGTGTPGEPEQVVVYPLSHDLVNDGRVITYRHIPLKDER